MFEEESIAYREVVDMLYDNIKELYDALIAIHDPRVEYREYIEKLQREHSVAPMTFRQYCELTQCPQCRALLNASFTRSHL